MESTKRNEKKKKVEINPYILEQSPNPKDPTQHPFYFCAPQFKNTGGDQKFIPKKKKRITAQNSEATPSLMAFIYTQKTKYTVIS